MAAVGVRIFPIVPESASLKLISGFAAESEAMEGRAADALGRPLKDLRISVIDQCNFRCSYCMPKSVFGKDYEFLPRRDLLSVAEIYRVASAFVNLGVRKIRLTGGEPLLRKELPDIIRALAVLRGTGGEDVDIALTTNGSLLAKKAAALRQAGLRRVTVSLDALDDQVFQSMNDVGVPVAHVLDGIDEAIHQGLAPVKVNMVVKRGENDSEVIPMADYFRDRYGPQATLRFIEFMDVGCSNKWEMDKVVSSGELIQRLQERFPIEPVETMRGAETAERWRYLDGRGEIGFISSVTRPFCGNCCRARLSADWKLFTCLFAQSGYDLRGQLRSVATLAKHPSADGELVDQIRGIWSLRYDRYSESRSDHPREEPSKRVEMHYVGG